MKIFFLHFGCFNALLLLSSYAHSLPAPKSSWSNIISVGGGIVGPISLGTSQTFPIINPETDEFFDYSHYKNKQNKGFFEVFLGSERTILPHWKLQGGISYAQADKLSVKGGFIQGADLISSDTYEYRFNIRTRQLMAQFKYFYTQNEMIQPFALIGVGYSFNQTSNYSTNAPPLQTFTRSYQNKNTNDFSYRLGLGVDFQINEKFRLGFAYRFADLGQYSFGKATINDVSVPGALSQSNLYVNEGVVQLSYVI